MHGNLTPNNVVFLSEEGPDATDQVALTDFYQASLTVGQADMRENEHPNLLFYMAPEQFFDVHTIRTPQSDQYALACLAYELLTGNPPFVASARNTLQGMHENAIPQPPSASNPALPAVCDVVILKALSKQPDERYLDIRSFLAALQLEEQTARTATALSLVADQNTALFSLASEVEAISKATDELISRETSRHAAITLANVNTPASNVVPSGMLTSSFPEQTLLLPTQPPERSQQKSTRTLLLAAMITLLVSLLGCAVFAFALPGITSNNLSANTTSMGGNIVQPDVTYTATKAIDTHMVHQKVSPTVRVIATPTHQVATPTANAQSMLTAHPTFTPTPTSTVMPFTVKPTLECVQPQGLTSYLAKFGYINSSPTNIKIPVGYNNYMSPSSYNNQLPTNFVPGRQDAILQLHASNGSTLTWILDGTSVTANMFSKRCP